MFRICSEPVALSKTASIACYSAETAQLQVGDVILKVNGIAVTSITDLQAVIHAAASSDALAVGDVITALKGKDVTPRPVGGNPSHLERNPRR